MIRVVIVYGCLWTLIDLQCRANILATVRVPLCCTLWKVLGFLRLRWLLSLTSALHLLQSMLSCAFVIRDVRCCLMGRLRVCLMLWRQVNLRASLTFVRLLSIVWRVGSGR